MNKKVLIVASHFYPNVGGVETHLDDLVKALRKRDWEVTVATYTPLAKSVPTKLYESGKRLKIYRMPWIGFNLVHKLTPYPPLEFLYLFPGLFFITGLTLLLNPSTKIIHAQGLVPVVASLFWGRLLRKKVLVSTHNLYFFPKEGLYKEFSKLVFASVDKVLCLSNASEKEIKRIGVPQRKIGQFRYWLNLDLFKPMKKKTARQKLGLRDEFIAFLVGRLIETKGVNVLLECSRNVKNITFVFAGLGPLENKIKIAEKQRNVSYVGQLKPEEVRMYMSAADLVVVPSLVDEGYGRVAMEALASGTPVLAAKRGGLSEIVSAEIGWLVEPNEKNLSKILRYLLANPKEVLEKKKRTRKYALQHFGEKNVEEIIKAYQT